MSEPMANSESSLLAWHASLRENDHSTIEKLWRMYFQRMVDLARKKLLGAPRGMADEEDVALSAFKSFCLGFQQGKFPDPGTAPNLWPLLVSLTLNKAVDHVRRENRLKRRPPQPSDGRNSPKPALAGDADWNELVSREPTPELAAAAAESFQDLMAALDQTGDATLRRITLQSICGYTTSQLAKELGCTPRTVQRKLQTIRAIWEARQP